MRRCIRGGKFGLKHESNSPLWIFEVIAVYFNLSNSDIRE